VPNGTSFRSPKRRTEFRQVAERNPAKTPNEITPKRRTKSSQNAERNPAKTPNEIQPSRRKELRACEKAGMLRARG
jgi:hypothetical protein